MQGRATVAGGLEAHMERGDWPVELERYVGLGAGLPIDAANGVRLALAANRPMLPPCGF